MIPYFTVAASLVYVALIGVDIYKTLRMRPDQRVVAAATVLAAATLLNAAGGSDWAIAGIWALNLAFCLFNLRYTRRLANTTARSR